jgi:glycosyltransferase involved in cell wall biosynthesis
MSINKLSYVLLGDQKETSDQTKLVKNPLVSVLMITYNQAAYLEQAIMGVIEQQCDFRFELIIGEDASSDDTRKIALQHQQRYPEIIRVIYSSNNVGAKANTRRIFSLARGKYVAYCEGDDYWCSKHKLARQVEIIQRVDDTAVVHTDWVCSGRRRNGWKADWRNPMHRRVSPRLLEGDLFRWFYNPKILRTCTVLFRRSVVQESLESRIVSKEYPFGDVIRSAYVTSKWRVAYLPEITAVYRLSPGSVLRSGTRARLAYLRANLEFDTEARKYFSNRPDYPSAYRWEMSVGLFLWAIKGLDLHTASFALADIHAHFGPVDFLKAGWHSLMMRWPSLRRKRRTIPETDTQSSTSGPSA